MLKCFERCKKKSDKKHKQVRFDIPLEPPKVSQVHVQMRDEYIQKKAAPKGAVIRIY